MEASGRTFRSAAIGKPSGTILKSCSETGAFFPTGSQAASFRTGIAARRAEAGNSAHNDKCSSMGLVDRTTNATDSLV
jgi:hypothetical protein